MIVDIPEWVSTVGYFEIACFVMMFGTFMMNTHSSEWEWWHVIAFGISAICGCIVIPALVVFKIFGVI